MSATPYILYIPDIALEKIFSFLTYDEIAKNRLACLSIDNPQKVMILGQSKDLGTCKSLKKNGESCNAIVNVTNCEFCIYHIKQEYQKCSKRSELQANFAGRGLTALRNKVLGKNEVFYAGKSYTAIPAKKSRKLQERDNGIMDTLNGTVSLKTKKPPSKKQSKVASNFDVSHKQRLRDLTLLERLGEKKAFTADHSTETSLETAKKSVSEVLGKLREKKVSVETTVKNGNLFPVNDSSDFSSQNEIEKSKEPHLDSFDSNDISSVTQRPLLTGSVDGLIDLDCNVSKNVNRSKPNALKYVQKNGTLNKTDSNEMKKSKERHLESPAATSKLNSSIVSNLTLDTVSDSSTVIQRPLLTKDVNDLIDLDSKKVKTAKLNALKYTEKNGTLDKSSSTEMTKSKERHLESPAATSNLNSSIVSNLTLETVSDSSTVIQRPLLTGNVNGLIDLDSKKVNRAKLNALKYVQKNGTLAKSDPNEIKKSRKRPLASPSETICKKLKTEFISDRFKKIMEAASSHNDLLEQYDQQEQDKYFYKLEMKEKMEEKMMTTYKVPCKAVRCLECKYTSFSASQYCKDNKHKLRVYDAVKRFFQCGGCGNRTVTLEVVPTSVCKNCGAGKWERTGMMKEKKVEVKPKLSIRGGEQKFINSVASDANLDLLVPE